MARSDTYDVLTGLPGKVPYDIATKQMSLKRKRQIFEAMQAQSIGGGGDLLDVGGGWKQANWSDPIGKIAKAYFSKKGLDDVSKEEDMVAKDYAGQTSAGLEKYMNTRDGSALLPSVKNDDEGNAMPAYGRSKGDPKRAIFEAMASGNPELTAVAKTDLASMGKDKLTPDKILTLDGYAPDVKQKAAALLLEGDQAGAIAALSRGKRELKAVNDKVVSVPGEGSTEAPTVLGDYGAKFGPVTEIAPGVPGQTDLNSGKASGITGGSVTPPTPPLSKAFAPEVAKQLTAGYQEANDSVKALQVMANAQHLLERIPEHLMGAPSDIILEVNKWGKAINMPAIPQIHDMQKLRFALGENLINSIRALAPVTKTDIAVMQNIVGTATNTKEALEGAINHVIAMMGRNVDKHNSLVKKASAMPGGEEAGAFLVDYSVRGDTGLGAPTSPAPQRMRFDAQGNPVQ